MVDVGEGEELSPLLKMLDDIREAASNIKLGLNIDLGSEISEKLGQNVSQATQRQVTAYQKLLKEMFKVIHTINEDVICEENRKPHGTTLL